MTKAHFLDFFFPQIPPLSDLKQGQKTYSKTNLHQNKKPGASEQHKAQGVLWDPNSRYLPGDCGMHLCLRRRREVNPAVWQGCRCRGLWWAQSFANLIHDLESTEPTTIRFPSVISDVPWCNYFMHLPKDLIDQIKGSYMCVNHTQAQHFLSNQDDQIKKNN